MTESARVDAELRTMAIDRIMAASTQDVMYPPFRNGRGPTAINRNNLPKISKPDFAKAAMFSNDMYDVPSL